MKMDSKHILYAYSAHFELYQRFVAVVLAFRARAVVADPKSGHWE